MAKLYDILYRCGHQEKRAPTYSARFSKNDLERFKNYLCPVCIKVPLPDLAFQREFPKKKKKVSR